MSERTWGYAGQVGRWEGMPKIPPKVLHRSVAATEYLLESFVPLLAEIHRPAAATTSWAEYDEKGRETAYHELVETAVADWDSLGLHVRNLAAAAGRVELHSLFITLDTAIAEAVGEWWAERSATFQVSVTPPGMEPRSVAVGYTTSIDVWLSTTYDERYSPRSNREAAARNGPRLTSFLRGFAQLVGDTFHTDLSQLYYFAIGPTGFRPVDDLPPRGGR